jgi:hypothetical protein
MARISKLHTLECNIYSTLELGTNANDKKWEMGNGKLKIETEINVCGVFEHVRQKYELADTRGNVDEIGKRKT